MSKGRCPGGKTEKVWSFTKPPSDPPHPPIWFFFRKNILTHILLLKIAPLMAETNFRVRPISKTRFGKRPDFPCFFTLEYTWIRLNTLEYAWILTTYYLLFTIIWTWHKLKNYGGFKCTTMFKCLNVKILIMNNLAC